MSKKKKIILGVIGVVLVIGFLIARNSFLNFQEEQRMNNLGNTMIQDWKSSSSRKLVK